VNVSDVLRLAADELPMTRAKWMNPHPRFICDLLTGVIAPISAPYEKRRAAKAFLVRLGMPTGMNAFGPEEYFSPSLQRMRRAWLLFAADLWDEGVR